MLLGVKDFEIWHILAEYDHVFKSGITCFHCQFFLVFFPIWPWSLTIPPISSIRFHPKDRPGISAETALWTGLRCFCRNSTCWWSTVTTVMHLKMSGTAMQKWKLYENKVDVGVQGQIWYELKTLWPCPACSKSGWVVDRGSSQIIPKCPMHCQVRRLPFLNSIAPLCSNGSSKQHKKVIFFSRETLFLFPILQNIFNRIPLFILLCFSNQGEVLSYVPSNTSGARHGSSTSGRGIVRSLIQVPSNWQRCWETYCQHHFMFSNLCFSCAVCLLRKTCAFAILFLWWRLVVLREFFGAHHREAKINIINRSGTPWDAAPLWQQWNFLEQTHCINRNSDKMTSARLYNLWSWAKWSKMETVGITVLSSTLPTLIPLRNQ